MNSSRIDLIADEILIIQYSGGEIPEVAFQGTLFYLTEDPDGPGLIPEARELLLLKKAVIARYRDILLRDLLPENRDKGLYRGLARSLVNWRRLLRFCGREQMDLEEIRVEAARALRVFLDRERCDVREHGRDSCINCSAEELGEFVGELGLPVEELPTGWQDLCPA